jgi:hypothetical protein
MNFTVRSGQVSPATVPLVCMTHDKAKAPISLVALMRISD